MIKTGIGTAVVTVALIGLWVGGCGEATKAGKTVRLKKDYPIEPVAFTDVKFTDEFWAPRIETNRTVTIPHILEMCEKSGRVDNFAIAGGLVKGEQKGGFPFDDSDVYKIIEAASYSLSVQPDEKLEKYIDDLIVKIAAAQEDDGYLYTARTNKSKRLANWFGSTRWSKLGGSHELYNMGHLYEAAVAHYKATGKRTLLKVAIKNACLLDKTFGPGKLRKWPGHQEIEIGLVKLYRVTGNEKYLNLAKFFLDTRGPGGGEYAQAHKKPYEQTEAVGHAVRATYMYCGMTDVAALTGDERYAGAVERLWDDVVGKKMYLTGGIGAKGEGEAFGKEYDLPNATAYCETCAAIGNAMWNYRMFQLTGDAKYLDVFERVLYNGLISGVSLSGDRFFYTNPLESSGKHKREPWFTCACCPGNIARIMATLPGYAYAKSGNTVYVNMFVAGEGTIKLKDNTVRISQATWYPWDGLVKMTVEPARAGKFTIAVRMPGWAKGKPVPSDLYRYMDTNDQPVILKLNDAVLEPAIRDGFACIEREWKKGDVIELELPMPARRVVAHPSVEADKNRVAIKRGPIVYCAEWPDNDVNVLDLALADDAGLWSDRFRHLLNDVTVIRSRIQSGGSEHEFLAIPYYAWANRGQGSMAVWLKREEPIRTVEVEIDAGKTKEPISKYIYGQFIEHLGRCIYGGIWAEMLEDRKFYYPITDKYSPWGTGSDRQWGAGAYKYLKASPWKVIGPAGTVTMDTNNPYVGKHTPVVYLPRDGNEAGISQDGLAIVKGKGYTGRIILAGDKEAAPIVVRIVPENGEAIKIGINEIGLEFKTYILGFTAPESSDSVRIEIISKGRGTFRIGTLSLMPADNIKGWRSDVVVLLKELNSPIYRWPGGNFISGYNWRDGIGERDKRPPRKNPAWKGVEHDDVGIHEFMELMEIIGSEAYIALNTGRGTVEEAAEEVEYCNGSADTPMGKLRAQNGHPEPYGVKWWAVGNEMYGSWQLGNMPLAEYVKKHNKVAEQIWKVDPNAKLVGVGSVGNWSRAMLKECSDYMNLISEHIYCKENRDVVKHSKLLANEIKRVANEHRKYRRDINEIADKNIRIAMDEWNYWYGNYIYGELGVQYHLKDALGVATGLHEYFRNSDLYFMANYAQTVNVIGAIKTSRTSSTFDTTGLALKLYRQHFGEIPIVVTGNVSPMDISAAWTSDRKALTIGVVNPTASQHTLAIDLKGVNVADKARQWIITGTDPLAHNEPGKEPEIVVEEKAVEGLSNKLTVPGYSVSIFELAAE
ncbi:MAG: beta-L-arabinofuranosidase domain-containing protein [Planctomycetota bacterium]